MIIFSFLTVFQVSLHDMLQHFSGLSEESVLGLLGDLEADFVIFKKNDMYRIF